MAKPLTITAIERAGNGFHVRFGKMGRFFNNIREVRNYCDDADSDEALLKLTIALWLRRNPTLDRADILEGKTITLDLTNANPLRIA